MGGSRGFAGLGGLGWEVRQNKTNAMKHFKIQINAISAVSLFYFAQFFGVWRSFRFYFSQPTNQPASQPACLCLLYCYYYYFFRFFNFWSRICFVSFRFIFGNNIVCHDNNKSRGRNGMGRTFCIGFGFWLWFWSGFWAWVWVLATSIGCVLSQARGLNVRSELSFCNLSQLLGVGMAGR